MSEINKEWVQNVGLALADSCICPLYACTQCPNGTIHCDECFAIFMKNHDAEVKAQAIDEFYNRLLDNKTEINTSNYPWNYIELVARKMTETLKEKRE